MKYFSSYFVRTVCQLLDDELTAAAARRIVIWQLPSTFSQACKHLPMNEILIDKNNFVVASCTSVSNTGNTETGFPIFGTFQCRQIPAKILPV
jgi:hypothetical protein